MQDPLISIIVPIYNVEPYLSGCLDSIINQSYTNLEIILVDDGSPDGCGSICDSYVVRDGRIKVIHKENGGVSSARNAGLRVASGLWIGWVDPDDWIEPDMFKYLLDGACRSRADIVVCGRRLEYQDRCVERTWETEQCLNTEDALKLLLENDIMQNFLWDKMWKRELFEGVEFPEGRTYEDISVMHQLFARATSVCCLPEIKYHYRQRGDSIVSNITLKNRVNHYLAARQRYEEMRENWPQFQDLLEAQCIASSIGIWCGYLENPIEERKRYWVHIQEIAAFSRLHGKPAKTYMGLGSAGRVLVRLIPYPYWWSFLLARFCGKLYQIKNGVCL